MKRLVAALCAFMLALPALAGPLAPPVPRGAWTAYTPVVSVTSGALGSYTASGRYQVTGKRVDVTISVQVTTVGTAGGAFVVSLPATASGAYQVITGAEFSSTGWGLSGRIGSGSGTVAIVYAKDNSFPAANGVLLVVSGSYEAQ